MKYKNILITGPQGCGKTAFAHNLLKNFTVPNVRIYTCNLRASEMLTSPYVDVSMYEVIYNTVTKDTYIKETTISRYERIPKHIITINMTAFN